MAKKIPARNTVRGLEEGRRAGSPRSGFSQAGCLRSIVLLHDELADGVLLLARDADEVGALGIAREVEGDCLIA